ncbi:MAG: IS66 family insertion sequence element accessory protein TnpB [Bacteroidota bacterium]
MPSSERSMLSLGSSHRYYLYRAATDMRKGFDGLSGLVVNELGRDPLSGEVFVFVNRKGDRMKLLVWERGGFVLWYKRLESGTFELPGSDSKTYRLGYEELVLLLEGIVLESVRRRKRFHKKVGEKL